MNSAYLAISYICNQKCSFCPCTKEEKKFKYMDFQEVKDSVFRLKEELGIMEVVLSGGEPTLHPNFFDIISYLDSMNIKITLLSNAEKLDDINFVREISNRINSNNISVITTIHSQTEELHERVNGSKGSFRKTIRGLVNVNQAGFHTIVKHCVTKENYTELKEFFQFVDNTFPQSVDMQLCSIDYCGLEEEIKNNYKLEFPRMRPYLEKCLINILKKENQDGWCIALICHYVLQIHFIGDFLHQNLMAMKVMFRQIEMENRKEHIMLIQMLDCIQMHVKNVKPTNCVRERIGQHLSCLVIVL